MSEVSNTPKRLHPLLEALTKIYWLAPVDSQISRIAKEALLRGL